jgi:hypothetical protein
LLCVYCHDNEHSRYVDNDGRTAGAGQRQASHATHRPFADLKNRLGKKGD